MERCSCHRYLKCPTQRLENIEEEEPKSLIPASLRPPETPTETMEFLARSWSPSAVEILKALTVLKSTAPSESTAIEKQNHVSPADQSAPKEPGLGMTSQVPVASEAVGISPPISPRDNIELKLLRSAARGKTMGGWRQDHKEKRRVEARTRSAQVYAATSVAGVAAAVAAVVAGTVFSPGGSEANLTSNTTAAIASAAALVASHCMEMAQALGAPRDQIFTVIHSAINAQTSGDVMALTAGAATALRGAATLRARLHKEFQGTAFAGENKESEGCPPPVTFVSRGGELLKRTRKGLLHWKQVSVNMNSSWQVILKMKSTHMAGTFVKKRKGVVIGVYSNIPAWPGRELEDCAQQRAYFGIKTHERTIEFECINKCDQQIWVEGIRKMLDCCNSLNIAMPK